MADERILETSPQHASGPRTVSIVGFHGIVVVLTLWLLWVVSVPGVALPSGYVPVLGLCIAAVAWTAWAIAAPRRGTLSWWFAIEARVAEAERTPGDDVHVGIGEADLDRPHTASW